MAFKKRRYWDNQPQEAVPVKDLGFTEVFTGASIGYNHATGKQIAVTAGGTGFSQRATPYGLSLYTPNGGWADLAVDLDWSGPNTISCLIVIHGIDANYGGLFSKDSSSPSTQFAVGRYTTSDALYSSVDDAVAREVTASSISALVGIPAILTFTHSGVAATYGYIYLNGELVGQTSTTLGTQPTGTGPLGLGRARDSADAYDSDVDWLGFARAPRVMDAAEIQQYFSTPQSFWGLFAPQTIWVPVSAGGGTVTLAAQDAAHAHALDNAALSIGVTLTVADLAHGHALDASTLSTGTALAVADAQHAHALDNVTLSTTGATSLTVADLLHAHTLDAVVLTSDAYLAVADMLHAHALDNVGLTSDAYLTVADSLHAHALDNVGLTSDAYLAAADLAHAHALDAVVLGTEVALAVADALHAHALDGVTLTLGGIDLVIAGVMHAHALDTLALTLDTYLAIADALHAHALDNADLSLDTYLVVADALHAHAIDNLTLSFPATGALSDAEFRQMYDWLYALSQKQLLTVGTFLALK